MTPALRATADHLHPAGETCPYCEQIIPNDRAEEIRARFDLKQRQQEAAVKVRAEQQLAEARTQLEAAKKAEIAKLQQDSAAAIDKMKADALAQQAAARDEGKKLATAEAQLRIDAMVAEREVAKRKAEEAEQLKLAAVAQLEANRAQQDTTLALRTAEVRTAMEKNKVDEINSINAKHAEETKRVSEQMKAMQRRLDAVEGEGANIKLLDVLKENFPKDDIKPVRKSSGADIVHIVKHNKKECGVIVYDSRNRNAWNPKFASDLRGDMIAGKAVHAILTTGKFPGGHRNICLFDGVLVANPANVLALAAILRDEVVRNHSQRVSAEDRDRKTAKLYEFIASERFDNVLGSLAANDEKLFLIDEEEQQEHQRVWKRRRLLTSNSQKLHGTLRSEIDRIIDTAEAD